MTPFIPPVTKWGVYKPDVFINPWCLPLLRTKIWELFTVVLSFG